MVTLKALIGLVLGSAVMLADGNQLRGEISSKLDMANAAALKDISRGLICNLVPAPGYKTNGTIIFKQLFGATLISAKIENLDIDSGTRSWHLHAYGDMTGVGTGANQCLSLGPHYNPLNATHGAPENPPTKRHVGDLGNFPVSNYRATIHQIDKLIRLQDIVGRGIVIHGGVDDLGLGGDAGSLAAGNSGPRIACCTIAIPQAPVGGLLSQLG